MDFPSIGQKEIRRLTMVPPPGDGLLPALYHKNGKLQTKNRERIDSAGARVYAGCGKNRTEGSI